MCVLFTTPHAAAVRDALARVAAHGAGPDFRAYGLLIQHCADRGLLGPGRQLHARLVLFSVSPDNYLASKLLTLYSRCGRLSDARRLFDAVPSKNLFSWNAMLLAYALHDFPLHALHLFSALSSALKPDAFSLSALLKSLSASSSSALSTAHRNVHAFALRHGFDSDLFVANGLITACARADDLLSARKLFDEMPNRDIISWNAMISSYSQAGHYEACLQLYQAMEQVAAVVTPNSVTVVSVLHACAQLNNLNFGMEVHRSAVENGIEMDTRVWNSIIGFYAKCGSLDHARRLFEKIPEKDVVTYSAMISGYMSYGFVESAMELFGQTARTALSTWNAVIAGLVQNNCHTNILEVVREMQASGLRPNSVTLSSVLPALSFYTNLLVGKEIHGLAIKNDCDQNIYVATALIDAYAKAGYLDGARTVFESTKIRSVIVWTAIISAYSAHGDANTALALFDDMLASGTKPDHVTFTAVLSACAHTGVIDEARRIFNSILPTYGITPSVEHYACMAGVLSRGRMLNEAVEFINEMPFEPNAKAWGALLSGASISGDVELARFAFDRLFAVEPNNTGNYIVMANIYSRVGKWEEAEKVREKMKSVGLVKVPGCSWIEMSNGLQVFLARDSCSSEVYMVLEGLIGLMREEGCLSKIELYDEVM